MTARILVVDDVAANSRLLEAKLRAEYYQVACAQDGFEALDTARSWQPDLILLDIMMPGMDGYQCCRNVKQDPMIYHIPIIMITALGEIAERLRGLEAGADDFLTKPIEYETLMVRIRSLVRLKRLLDEWRSRGDTARSLGLASVETSVLSVVGTRALLVDDWDQCTDLVVDQLAQDGITTITAKTVSEAFEVVESVNCDLLVISLSLGDEDALRLVSAIRAADASNHIPLLLIAEDIDKVRILRGLDLGANDWLMQPIEGSELRLRARNQIRRKLYQERLKSDVGTSLELALLDPLTGLYNQRYLKLHLGWLAQKYANSPVSILMIDVDKFKLVNDLHGHATGDLALQLIATTLRSNLRVVDCLVRYGGEEFLVLMPDLEQSAAIVVAERLRRLIEFAKFITAGGVQSKLTVSIGVSTTHMFPTNTDQLFNEADLALYAAKRNGRNQTVLYKRRADLSSGANPHFDEIV